MPTFDVEFVDGVTDLAYGIEELRRREEQGEPTYALASLLLFQGEGGLDGAVADYVRDSWQELDAFTGGAAVVFVPAGMDGPLSPPALVQLINHVQVPFDALPCLWYFVDPAHSDRVTYVPLMDVVGRHGAAPYSAVDVRHTMRTFAELAWKCADQPPAKRLACVDQGLVNLHRQVFPDKAARPKLRLEHVSLGLSIVQVLMGLPPLL